MPGTTTPQGAGDGVAPTRHDVAALGDLVRRTVLEMGGYTDRAASARGLHRTHLNALAILMDHDLAGERATPGSLGAALGLSSAATTALLDRLEGAGHATRSRSAADRRVVDIDITASALEAGREIYLPLVSRMSSRLGAFTADELGIARAVLEAVLAAVLASHDEPDLDLRAESGADDVATGEPDAVGDHAQ